MLYESWSACSARTYPIRRTSRDFAIYENEYGEADIDARRLHEDSDLRVWESVENCICCSGKQDFAASILTISNSIDPEFLIVEPTGVAKLQSILENIGRVTWERISLLAPVTIVDAQAWQQQRHDFPEIFDNQLSAARSVVVSKLSPGSKVDDAAVTDVTPIVSLVSELNPEAELIAKSSYADIPDEWWGHLLYQPFTKDKSASAGESICENNPHNHSHHEHEDIDLETMSLQHAELPSPAHLIWLLDAASAGVFGKLARAKGSLPCGNQWLKFDLVERAWAITGDEPQEDSRCVFIGRNLLRSGLREVFVPALWHDDAEIKHEHEHGHEHKRGHEHGHQHERHDHDDHGIREYHNK